ncbi:ATP synthase F0 subunit A [Candidatus Roizmanbacteria bacterium CG10_big_fil_rev_8_21_14_0_10_45_7]|uniref:ATP synthase subunit a n=1 Tax=Candidatus Roizmanbacteria bacterium CG10_big_fil_rev_8_21_14_0_10_45_7 TaxID=1974854 RepID=A0A2M8KUG2_9BACT|nr:MAG: ATP synthase F0 subunit A [Candidatus Roizmanbacteria bacterium CG10_big_fil_rev_8_21_14_0_10_45_7]
MPHISIKAETLFHAGLLSVTNSFITNILVALLLIVVAVMYYGGQKTVTGILDLALRGLYGLFAMVFGDSINKYFPVVATFFIYILIANWFGLLPGVGSIGFRHEESIVPFLRGGTADLSTTLGLSVLAIGLVQFYGIRELGFRAYMSKFINLRGPMDFVLGLLEIISELSRALSLAFRLFGNIIAGEVLLVIVAFLIPYFVSLPFLVFEIFVGLIQAVVFTMLVSIFISVATTKHSA